MLVTSVVEGSFPLFVANLLLMLNVCQKMSHRDAYDSVLFPKLNPLQRVVEIMYRER